MVLKIIKASKMSVFYFSMTIRFSDIQTSYSGTVPVCEEEISVRDRMVPCFQLSENDGDVFSNQKRWAIG